MVHLVPLQHVAERERHALRRPLCVLIGEPRQQGLQLAIALSSSAAISSSRPVCPARKMARVSLVDVVEDAQVDALAAHERRRACSRSRRRTPPCARARRERTTRCRPSAAPDRSSTQRARLLGRLVVGVVVRGGDAARTQAAKSGIVILRSPPARRRRRPAPSTSSPAAPPAASSGGPSSRRSARRVAGTPRDCPSSSPWSSGPPSCVHTSSIA